MSDYRIETKCVQAGYTPGNGEPRQIPIIQSTTFKYATSEDMGKLFDLEASGYFYSRLQNPTCDHVAAKIAALEGGSAAMLTGSGQAANFMALFNICEAGSHIVASSSIYGGTFNLIAVTLKKMGIASTFVSPNATDDELDRAFRPNTRAMFGETIANPALTVLDIEKFAQAAHRHGVPLIVDNTFPTPVNCQPIRWGADIVTHSTTKYMDGHGAALGGVIVDSGNFDWMAHAEKYPGLCTPDESYHGITYAEKFGNAGAYITKCTSQLMRDLGCVQSPQNAFILNLGLESLHVRMPRHCENAMAVAQFLEKQPLSANLGYPIGNRERLRQPALAGGALLDLGVYALNFASMVFGTDVERVTSTCVKTDTGVDAQTSITLTFKDGKIAVLHSSMLSMTDRQGIISGDKGHLIIENINNPQRIRVVTEDYKTAVVYNCPPQITGYEYQVYASMEALRNGWLESPYMPHAETLRIMRMMDDLRREWGVHYPADE